MSIWGPLFFLGLGGVGEDQNGGEDIGAKEEGTGWGTVRLLDDQHQVVQGAGKSAPKSLLHGFDCKKMRRLVCR